MPRTQPLDPQRFLMTLGLLVLALLSHAARAGETAPRQAVASPFLAAAPQALAAAACRAQALAAEQAADGAAALTAWERVIDRCPSTEDQRVEARAHIKTLRLKTLRNTDPAQAHPWKVLVVIFRKLELSWTDAQQHKIAAQKTVSADDEKKMRNSIAAFGRHVFQFSSGRLRVDADIKVITEPLTRLDGPDRGPFTPAPHILRPALEPLIKDMLYDTVFVYVKYNGDQGPPVPAPWTAATFESCGEVQGAGFIMVPWHTNYPYPGETDGEMELHEWLHQVDWMFCHVLHYPDELVPSSDCGRMEGDQRPGGDTEYVRKNTETTWIKLYQHIMEDHITRQMWSEAAMRWPVGQLTPGDVCKPKP